MTISGIEYAKYRRPTYFNISLSVSHRELFDVRPQAGITRVVSLGALKKEVAF